ncbi:MAG: hypothetical protein A2V63_01245 [Candidatus Eisenbacteria bacterium RBG_19FT_COMBO_70_11]|nr:MAG: hypothetical protein A2V63_01245 [Candidatus Eisenbacteria bacterium RBG_19FT_COMBO_70_11]
MISSHSIGNESSEFSIWWRVRNRGSNRGDRRDLGVASISASSRSGGNSRATTSRLTRERLGWNPWVSTLPVR